MIFTVMRQAEPDNKDKFHMLYDKYSALVYYIALGKLQNHEKAEDCVQETFLYVAQNIEKIDDVESESTKCYIATIAQGKAISMFRKEVIRVHDNIENYSSLPDASEFDGHDAFELSDELDKLPEEIKNIIILKYYYGFKSKEIAAFYGISSSLVRKKLQKGISMLKDGMKGA